MKNLFLILFILFISYSFEVTITDPVEIKALYNEMTKGRQAKYRKYMILELNLNEIRDTDYFQRIIKDFFLSNGFQSAIYNVRDEKFIAFLLNTVNIEIKTMKSYFGKSFKEIYWFDEKKHKIE